MGSFALVMLGAGITVAAKVLWELYLRPLARQRIPGPKWAALSDLWQYWLIIRRCRTATFHDLFTRYGPVVRVGPNCVAFRNIDSVKTIYGTHEFRKSSWYGIFTFGGADNIFSTQDPVRHALSRRLHAPAFRGDNLRAAGPVLLQEMEDLVDRLRRDSADGCFTDVIQVFPQLTIDILGLTVLGVRLNHIATGDAPEFTKNLQNWLVDKLLIRPLPGVIRELPIPMLQEIVTADAILTNYVTKLYEEADEKPTERGWSMLVRFYPMNGMFGKLLLLLLLLYSILIVTLQAYAYVVT